MFINTAFLTVYKPVSLLCTFIFERLQTIKFPLLYVIYMHVFHAMQVGFVIRATSTLKGKGSLLVAILIDAKSGFTFHVRV